jgi:hypothetical protein
MIYDDFNGLHHPTLVSRQNDETVKQIVLHVMDKVKSKVPMW